MRRPGAGAASPGRRRSTGPGGPGLEQRAQAGADQQGQGGGDRHGIVLVPGMPGGSHGSGLRQLPDLAWTRGHLGGRQVGTADPLDQRLEAIDPNRGPEQVLQRRKRGAELFNFLSQLRVPLQHRLDGVPLGGIEDTIGIRHQHFI